MDTSSFEIKDLAPVRAIGIRALVPHDKMAGSVDEACNRLLPLLDAHGGRPAGPPLVLQHDLAAPGGVDLEVCVPTPNLLPAENEVVPRELSGGLFASMVTVSPPDSISEAFADLALWACERGYVRAGPVRLVPLAIVGSPEEDKQHVIEVMFPVGVAA